MIDVHELVYFLLQIGVLDAVLAGLSAQGLELGLQLAYPSLQHPLLIPIGRYPLHFIDFQDQGLLLLLQHT